MYEVKLFEVINCKEALAKLLDEKMSAVLSRMLGKYFQIVEKEFAEFEKIRETKIKEYGEEFADEEGKKQTRVKPESMEQFVAELNELLNQPVSVPLKKLVCDEKFPALELRSAILMNWMFEEDGEKAAELQI